MLPFTVFEEQCFSSKVLYIIGKSYIVTIKNNDDWTFLIFFAFTIFFSLERKDNYIIIIWKDQIILLAHY